MRIKKFLPYLAMSLLFVSAIVGAAHCFAIASESEGPVRGGWSLSNITGLLNDVANWLYVIGFAVALIIIVLGGISYMTAGGDEEKTGKAKKTIITGLIGAAIILLAGIILDTLANFVGVTPPV